MGPQQANMEKLENAVHPLVETERENFLRANAGAKLVVLDVPLLFETKMESKAGALACGCASVVVCRVKEDDASCSGLSLP